MQKFPVFLFDLFLIKKQQQQTNKLPFLIVKFDTHLI